MLLNANYSGQHPELTTPNRRVGPISLSRTLLPSWLDERVPCWTESRHAYGPLFTDPDTGETGRDCYRCGKWFEGPLPDGRVILLEPLGSERPRAHHGFFDFFRVGRTRMQIR